LPGKRLRAGTLTIYVAEDVKAFLQRWAELEGRTTSNLAAHLISRAVRAQQEAVNGKS